MILDNLAKAAFGIINTVAPSLSPETFLKEMKDEFDPNLSDEENEKRMMEKIRQGKLGKKMAEAASYEPENDKSFEEVLGEVKEEAKQNGWKDTEDSEDEEVNKGQTEQKYQTRK